MSLESGKENRNGPSWSSEYSCGGRKRLELLGLVDFVGSFEVFHGFWTVSCLESFERVRRVRGSETSEDLNYGRGIFMTNLTVGIVLKI